jgi:hypothetical protein
VHRTHSLYAMRIAMTAHELSTRMSIPPMDPIRQGLPNTAPA